MHFASTMSRGQAIGLLAATAGIAAAPRAGAATAGFTEKQCRQALVIDAQGAFDLATGIEKGATDTTASGLTAIGLTMGLVGDAPNRL